MREKGYLLLFNLSGQEYENLAERNITFHSASHFEIHVFFYILNFVMIIIKSFD